MDFSPKPPGIIPVFYMTFSDFITPAMGLEHLLRTQARLGPSLLPGLHQQGRQGSTRDDDGGIGRGCICIDIDVFFGTMESGIRLMYTIYTYMICNHLEYFLKIISSINLIINSHHPSESLNAFLNLPGRSTILPFFETPKPLW